jgi:hypothetical protein
MAQHQAVPQDGRKIGHVERFIANLRALTLGAIAAVIFLGNRLL